MRGRCVKLGIHEEFLVLEDVHFLVELVLLNEVLFSNLI